MKKYQENSKGFLLIITCILSIIILSSISISTKIINSNLKIKNIKDASLNYDAINLKRFAIDELYRINQKEDMMSYFLLKDGKNILNQEIKDDLYTDSGYEIKNIIIDRYPILSESKTLSDYLRNKILIEIKDLNKHTIKIKLEKRFFMNEKIIIFSPQIELFFDTINSDIENPNTISLKGVEAKFEKN